MAITVVIDLRNGFGDIRDQDLRPTCMAFAASDAHSFARQSLEALSAEYAFFHAVQRKTIPDRSQGISFEFVSQAIATDGQPLELDWPYLTSLSASDDWNPPANIGVVFRRASKALSKDMSIIFSLLGSGHPVIIGMEISQSFYAKADAVVNGPINEPVLARHAVLAIGYGITSGGRCILIRNSWGKAWGDGGYAWLHENYMEPRLRVVGQME